MGFIVRRESYHSIPLFDVLYWDYLPFILWIKIFSYWNSYLLEQPDWYLAWMSYHVYVYTGEKVVKHCFLSSKLCSFYICQSPKSSVLGPATVKLRGWWTENTARELWLCLYGSKPEKQSEMYRGEQGTLQKLPRWRWRTGARWLAGRKAGPGESQRIAEEQNMICSHHFSLDTDDSFRI